MISGRGYQLRGAVAVIALPRRATSDCIRGLRSRSQRALAGGSRAVAVDLRATRHIDNETLDELGVALRRLSHHNPRLAVVGADRRVQRRLERCEIAGLEFHLTMRRALAVVSDR